MLAGANIFLNMTMSKLDPQVECILFYNKCVRLVTDQGQ